MWELFTCGEAFTCEGDIHVWRGHSRVGVTHVWRGHSRVEGTFMCGGDIHVWELFTVHGELTYGGGGNIRIHVYLQLPYMVHRTR